MAEKKKVRLVGKPDNKMKSDFQSVAATAFNTAKGEGRADGRPVFKLGGAKTKAKPAGGARPEKAGSYPAAKPKPAGARPEVPGAYTAAKATPAPKPKAKPAAAPPKPKAKPANLSKAPASSKMAYTAPSTQKRGNVFSGKNDVAGPKKNAAGKNANPGFASLRDMFKGKRVKK